MQKVDYPMQKVDCEVDYRMKKWIVIVSVNF